MRTLFTLHPIHITMIRKEVEALKTVRFLAIFLLHIFVLSNQTFKLFSLHEFFGSPSLNI